MNKRIRHIIISNNWIILSIDFLMRIWHKKTFAKRITENLNTDIFNIEVLSKHIPFFPIDKVLDNNLYGLSYILKKYAGVDVKCKLNASIEHGLFLGSLVREDDFLYHVNMMITFGDYRQRMLENGLIGKKIIKIGPYIHYANILLSEEKLKELKVQLGKVLLVFPSHSVKGVHAKYDENELITEIERIRPNFDNVLVCLFWRDVYRKDLIRQYREKGYLLTSAGHIHDINFLSRLKTIISIADITMSNSVGTHIGYCIYMNKPHYVYDQDITLKEYMRSAVKRELEQRTQKEREDADKDKYILGNHFNHFTDTISVEQKRIVDEYWGISYVRSPQALFGLLFKENK